MHSEWTAASIYRTMMKQGELDEKFIKIVVDRQFSRAMFYSIFYPSEWPTISKFDIHQTLILLATLKDRISSKTSLVRIVDPPQF
jgi:hypothetical protein